MYTAKDLMRRNVIAVTPETSTSEALDLLVDHNVSGLPVVDFGDIGQLDAASFESECWCNAD